LKKSLLMLPLVLIASALALSACGGGGSSSSGSGDDEAAIEEVIEESATSTDPAKCTEFQTEEFNEQDQGVSAKEATKVCEEAVKESETPAESVSVSNVKVNGETATADAEVEGSALNGQSVEIELAKEEGDWKLNQFLGFVKYDGKSLATAFEEELENQEELTPGLAKCLAEGIAKMSQSEAEALAFEQSTEGIEGLVETCQ
jgi:ABC-type oligopeptide transport system substrate-binding subunit